MQYEISFVYRKWRAFILKGFNLDGEHNNCIAWHIIPASWPSWGWIQEFACLNSDQPFMLRSMPGLPTGVAGTAWIKPDTSCRLHYHILLSGLRDYSSLSSLLTGEFHSSPLARQNAIYTVVISNFVNGKVRTIDIQKHRSCGHRDYVTEKVRFIIDRFYMWILIFIYMKITLLKLSSKFWKIGLLVL